MKKHLFLLIFFLGNFCFSQTELSSLKDSLNFAVQPEVKIDLRKKIALELKLKDWDKAINYIETAEKEAKKMANQEILASVYVTTGKLYYSKDVIDVALEYYLKAEEIYKESGNLSEQMSLQNNLAIIYARLNNIKKATFYFDKVFQYHQDFKTRDTFKYASILNNMGTLYLKEDLDSSLVFYNRALDVNHSIKNHMLYAYIYTNIGRTIYEMDSTQATKAKQYYDKAIINADKIENKQIKAIVQGYVSDFFLKEKENDSALFYAKKAVKELKKNPYTLNNQDAIEVIYKAYLNKKQYDSAASYFELYNEVRDSVQLEKQAVNVERIKLQQEYKSRLAVQKLEVEKEESKWFMTILALLCVLLFFAIILIKYRNKIAYNKIEQALIQEKNKELNSSLEQKNSELVGKTMIDAHKSNMVKSIIEDLKLIKRKATKKETQLLVSEVLKKLERDLNPDVWKEFEYSFKQVHPSFFNKLVEKHPELSSKERRLCILLYLDFSTKEIVKLTGVSYKSVENSRTRLRNKLNLTNKKLNISSYLRSIK